MFSHFLINILFLKNLAFLAKKTEILAKKFFFFFFAFLVKIFKNKKLIKKVRKHSLDTRSAIRHILNYRNMKLYKGQFLRIILPEKPHTVIYKWSYLKK